MKTYGLPLLLWASAVVGLVTMLLVENDLGDNLGLLLLVVPLAVLVRYGAITSSARR